MATEHLPTSLLQAAAEDIGAGMSVSWLDYDNDGGQDLYVANMWTAAGERVSTQEIFKKDSPAEVRALYQKHAMGNSLLHNRGTLDTTFDDATLFRRWNGPLVLVERRLRFRSRRLP
jgi:hypothetical protein